jgi:predicted nucleic-acid-binding protein
MISIDTNVLVRIVTRDDRQQSKAAARLFEGNPVFLSKTVMLETEWVLRYSYDLDRDTILETFHKLLGLPNLSVEDPQGVTQALLGYEVGLDFADSLHLASSEGAEKFVTFDRDLVKKAHRVEGFVDVGLV